MPKYFLNKTVVGDDEKLVLGLQFCVKKNMLVVGVGMFHVFDCMCMQCPDTMPVLFLYVLDGLSHRKQEP